MRFILALILTCIAAPSLAFASDWQPSYQYAQQEPQAAASANHFIEAKHIEASIKDALILRGVANDLNVTLTTPNTGVLYKAKTPLRVAIHGLTLQESRSAWQASAYILSPQKTVSVIPVSGQFESMVHVPVLKSYVAEGDVIRESDLEMQPMAESSLRRGTIKQKSALIGKAPRRGISAARPIRTSEIATPRLIKKGDSITLHYTSPYMTIRGVGKALEHGSMGDVIRVKNLSSDRDIVARVSGNNNAEVNMAADVTVATTSHY